MSFIQTCVRAGAIFWTHHITMRLSSRGISRDAVIASVDTSEVIEDCPDDTYLPSYLVLARAIDGPLHILFATDVDGGNVRVVTAYRPDPNEWDTELENRIAP